MIDFVGSVDADVEFRNTRFFSLEEECGFCGRKRKLVNHDGYGYYVYSAPTRCNGMRHSWHSLVNKKIDNKLVGGLIKNDFARS